MSVEKGKVRRRTGRPPKPALPGKRMSLGLKVTPEIKSRLDKAARETGRTQSQEAELRLEKSFKQEDMLPEVLKFGFGDGRAELLMDLNRSILDEQMGSGAFLFAADRWLRGSLRTKDEIIAAGENLDEILTGNAFVFVQEHSDEPTKGSAARAPAKPGKKLRRKRS